MLTKIRLDPVITIAINARSLLSGHACSFIFEFTMSFMIIRSIHVRSMPIRCTRRCQHRHLLKIGIVIKSNGWRMYHVRSHRSDHAGIFVQQDSTSIYKDMSSMPCQNANQFNWHLAYILQTAKLNQEDRPTEHHRHQRADKRCFRSCWHLNIGQSPTGRHRSVNSHLIASVCQVSRPVPTPTAMGITFNRPACSFMLSIYLTKDHTRKDTGSVLIICTMRIPEAEKCTNVPIRCDKDLTSVRSSPFNWLDATLTSTNIVDHQADVIIWSTIDTPMRLCHLHTRWDVIVQLASTAPPAGRSSCHVHAYIFNYTKIQQKMRTDQSIRSYNNTRMKR